jgi:hypothetical protein
MFARPRGVRIFKGRRPCLAGIAVRLQAFDPAGLETDADEADPHHD